MKSLLKTYENWVSSSTYPIPSAPYEQNPESEIEPEIKEEKTESKIAYIIVIKFINEYKKMFNKGADVKDIKLKAREEFGDDLYLLLELDSFFET
jgi:hypothetical protein